MLTDNVVNLEEFLDLVDDTFRSAGTFLAQYVPVTLDKEIRLLK